jgi:hypothetical protein
MSRTFFEICCERIPSFFWGVAAGRAMMKPDYAEMAVLFAICLMFGVLHAKWYQR